VTQAHNTHESMCWFEKNPQDWLQLLLLQPDSGGLLDSFTERNFGVKGKYAVDTAHARQNRPVVARRYPVLPRGCSIHPLPSHTRSCESTSILWCCCCFFVVLLPPSFCLWFLELNASQTVIVASVVCVIPPRFAGIKNHTQVCSR
jgi:hypothetical protein